MTRHVYLVHCVLLSDTSEIECKSDVGLTFDGEPSRELVAARIACALLAVEPGCTDVAALEFTRIA